MFKEHNYIVHMCEGHRWPVLAMVGVVRSALNPVGPPRSRSARPRPAALVRVLTDPHPRLIQLPVAERNGMVLVRPVAYCNRQ